MPYFPEAQTPQDALDTYNNRTILAAKFRVKWKDIFSAQEFYKATHEWMDEYGWEDHENKSENYETLYFEKVGAKGDKEIWIRWRLVKYPSDNPYYRYHLDLDFHYLYLIKTEVVHQGKKLSKGIYNGELEIWISSYIEYDIAGAWSKHPVLRMFNRIFPKRIVRKDLYEEHKRELYRETYILQNFIKHWFKLKRFLPYEEIKPFWPSYAYPSYSQE